MDFSVQEANCRGANVGVVIKAVASNLEAGSASSLFLWPDVAHEVGVCDFCILGMSRFGIKISAFIPAVWF